MDTDAAPQGATAELKSAKITSNPKVSKKVEKVVDDTDWKAAESMYYLYKKGFDENFITRMLSVGLLGTNDKRKLVPTRWGIAATDDTLGLKLIHQIMDFPIINEHKAFFGNYLGNYYLIMLFPEVWSYELFERYVGGTNYSTDYEDNFGRSSYAFNCAGGYYTVRLAILEKLIAMKRQASCLVVRLITSEYSVPLGVWVTRECSRKTMGNKPIDFTGTHLMLNYAKLKAKRLFNHNIEDMIEKSKLFNTVKTQTKLFSFG